MASLPLLLPRQFVVARTPHTICKVTPPKLVVAIVVIPPHVKCLQAYLLNNTDKPQLLHFAGGTDVASVNLPLQRRIKNAKPSYRTAQCEQSMTDIVMSHWITMGAGMTDMTSGNAAVSKRHANPVFPEFSVFYQNFKNASIFVCVKLSPPVKRSNNVPQRF